MSELSAKSDLVFTPVRKMPSGIFSSSYLTFLAQQPNFGREHLLSSLEKFEAWPLECWGYFIRRDFLLDNQISFEPIRISEDMVFMTTVFSKLNSYSIVQDFVYIHYRTPGSLGKSFSNHDIESWFSAFLGISNLAKEVPIGSSESRVIINRLSYTFAYVLVSFLLIGPLGKKDFSIWVTGGERTDLLHGLEVADTDQTHAKFDIFGKSLEEMSINIEKLLNPVGQGKTYLYCYDRLSLGVFEILKSLNFKFNGIVDHQCGGVIASTDFDTSPLSPETLYEELIENDTVVICHDKHSVFTSKQQELQGLQKRNIDATATVDAILTKDTAWRAKKTELEIISAELNRIAKQVGEFFQQGKQAEANEAKAKTVTLKEQESGLKAAVQAVEEEMQQLIVYLVIMILLILQILLD